MTCRQTVLPAGGIRLVIYEPFRRGIADERWHILRRRGLFQANDDK